MSDRNHHARFLIVALLTAAVLAVFYPVLGHGFVDYDDGLYVTDNPWVRSGLGLEGVRWAWTATRASNWHPVTWMSHMLDWQLHGNDPGGHHLTSLALHLINTILLFYLLDRMTGAAGRSAFVAALFAVHPLHVESVAWVAERKDVLSTAFWLLAALAYVRWTRAPGIAKYTVVVLATALGLAAKPMLVTLPFTLLLLDLWPLHRKGDRSIFRLGLGTDKNRSVPFSWLVGEKLPLFILAAASAVVTIVVQRSGEAMGTVEQYPVAVRVSNAAVACVSYLFKTFWPRGLAVFYPHPGDTLPVWAVAGSALLLTGITLVAFRAAGKRPYVTVGWLWYLGTLVPVLGLVQVGRQAMADRYTYVPLIGIFLIVAWGVPDLLRPDRRGRRVLAVTGTVAVIALGVVARAQVGHWRDSISLFEHTIDVAGSSGLAHNNLGIALAREGRVEEAMSHYRQAVRVDPGFAKAHNNLGTALAATGRTTEAIERYREALRIDPAYAEAHHNLGLALASRGALSEAIEHYAEALRIRPDYVEAHNNLGIALAQSGRFAEATERFAIAIRIDPGHDRAHLNRGLALAAHERWPEAAAHFAEATRIRPDSGVAHYHLAVALFFQGDDAGAWRHVGLARRHGYDPPASFLRDLSARTPEP